VSWFVAKLWFCNLMKRARLADQELAFAATFDRPLEGAALEGRGHLLSQNQPNTYKLPFNRMVIIQKPDVNRIIRNLSFDLRVAIPVD